VSRDVLVKENMVVVQRYVDVKGCVIECFIGIVHIKNTIALSLKETIEALFSKHRLSISIYLDMAMMELVIYKLNFMA
jgi:hypothetical protein